MLLGRIIANEHTHSLKIFELFKPKLRQHYILLPYHGQKLGQNGFQGNFSARTRYVK